MPASLSRWFVKLHVATGVSNICSILFRLVSGTQSTGSVRPASAVSAAERVIGVGSALKGLFPDGGLQRGGVFVLSGEDGSTSLLFGLLAGALVNGLWGAVLGVESFGVEAALGYEVPLGRIVLVPHLGPTWLEATAIMLGACDVVAVCPPQRCPAQQARFLAARARAHDAVLLVMPPLRFGDDYSKQWWPNGVDGSLRIVASCWRGLEAGHGTLRSREVELSFSGRRAGARVRVVHCLLPNCAGTLQEFSTPGATRESLGSRDINSVASRSG